MNWEEIKEKYPKGFDKLCEWLGIEEYDSDIPDYGSKWSQFKNDILTAYDGFAWNERNLFDFFDEQGIYIDVKSGYGITKILFSYNITLVFEIDDGFDEDWDEITCYDSWDTRKETEEQAFMKAFEILEEQLIK